MSFTHIPKIRINRLKGTKKKYLSFVLNTLTVKLVMKRKKNKRKECNFFFDVIFTIIKCFVMEMNENLTT